ncbi:hypothetical protein MBSD_n0257 [Mizugakiibacter sediminis]|uniref:Transmembrane protein n=1 Tax=Mizugakiibacter sediminis TaxID=1475481 RepID=A0A0K8QJG9_9GAMM|nr:hypothetical protein [Mizugakiibacter sediminis]GAP64974.1 hypothetical protein MBSD_n0257 [Mizugakiibacter sediminis]
MRAAHREGDPIPPYAHHLPAALRYPLQPAALTVIAVLAVAHFGNRLPVVGWLVEAGVWAAMYKYAAECLRGTADGRADPPETMLHTEDRVGWALVAIQLAVLIALALLGRVHAEAALVALRIAVAAVLPAVCMSLTMDGNVPLALNPATWVAVARRFGAAYAALVASWLGIGLARHVLQRAADAFLPLLLSDPLHYAFGNYALVLQFHLAGYLVYVHHARIGHRPAAWQRDVESGLHADAELVEQARSHTAHGAHPLALEALALRLREHDAPDAVHAEYRRLLRQAGDTAALLAHGRAWIGALLARDEAHRALSVVRECLALDPAFLPESPEQVLTLVRRADGFGMPRLALQLADAFAQRSPAHPLLPDTELVAARLLADRLDRRDEARRRIAAILARFPGHATAPALRALDARLGMP